MPERSTLDFGPTFVGASHAEVFSWRNDGPGDRRVLGFEAGPAPEFALGEASYAGGSLGAGQKTPPVSIVFNPSEEKDYSGSLRALLPGRPKRVTLKGRGVYRLNEGGLFLNDFSGQYKGAGAFDFGDTPVGSQKTRSFRLTNLSAKKPLICGFSWSSPDRGFRILTPSTLPELKSGESVLVTVAFEPSAAGESRVGVLFTDAADPQHRAGVVLSGRGVPLGVPAVTSV